MSFQTPLTIDTLIGEIHSKKYLLPSIQREFIWSKKQVTKLFDSLMRDYPFGSFLFWEVPNDKLNEFTFYEFLRDYHQRKKFHNEKANLNGEENIRAVLDGQQRLTSLYIGLKGSYANKLAYKRWDNSEAYPVKKLYINLLNEVDNNEFEYEFEFLTAAESEHNDAMHYWFLVGEILNMRNPSDVREYWSKNIEYGSYSSEQIDFANETLSKLYKVIHETPTICYYLENSTELDKVLNIFIRLNSGGTTLSYSDLLLSFATAQWDKLDARQVIHDFVGEANNNLGKSFNISKDFVLKSCLVLCDFDNISFKVDNFNRTTMLKIQDEWDNVSSSIRNALELIASFGFNRENITSNNLIIPIAYYLKSIGLPKNFETSKSMKQNRTLIKKWFSQTMFKKVFSFNPDGALKPIRKIIRENGNADFPLQKIIDEFKGTNRSISFTDEDIDKLLNAKYGQSNTLVIMSILFPWADLRNYFHIDHMYPKASFTRKKLENRKLSNEQIEFALENYNFIENLQFLESNPNREKKDTDFDKWISDTFTADEVLDYKRKNLISPDISLTYDNFENFFRERKKLMAEKLKSELM